MVTLDMSKLYVSQILFFIENMKNHHFKCYIFTCFETIGYKDIYQKIISSYLVHF